MINHWNLGVHSWLGQSFQMMGTTCDDLRWFLHSHCHLVGGIQKKDEQWTINKGTSISLYSLILLTALGYSPHPRHHAFRSRLLLELRSGGNVGDLSCDSWGLKILRLQMMLGYAWVCLGMLGYAWVNSCWRVGLFIHWLDMIWLVKIYEYVWATYFYFCWEPTQMNSSIGNPCDWVDSWPFLVWLYFGMVACAAESFDFLKRYLNLSMNLCWPCSSTSWHP